MSGSGSIQIHKPGDLNLFLFLHKQERGRGISFQEKATFQGSLQGEGLLLVSSC